MTCGPKAKTQNRNSVVTNSTKTLKWSTSTTTKNFKKMVIFIHKKNKGSNRELFQ